MFKEGDILCQKSSSIQKSMLLVVGRIINNYKIVVLHSIESQDTLYHDDDFTISLHPAWWIESFYVKI